MYSQLVHYILFRKHVHPDTNIITDCWRGYAGLTQEGFRHKTVNHTLNFVDPDTGANTNKIESQWRPIRQRLARGGVKNEYLADHLCEFLWRRDMKREGSDPFESLITNIRSQFRF